MTDVGTLIVHHRQRPVIQRWTTPEVDWMVEKVFVTKLLIFFLLNKHVVGNQLRALCSEQGALARADGSAKLSQGRAYRIRMFC